MDHLCTRGYARRIYGSLVYALGLGKIFYRIFSCCNTFYCNTTFQKQHTITSTATTTTTVKALCFSTLDRISYYPPRPIALLHFYSSPQIMENIRRK